MKGSGVIWSGGSWICWWRDENAGGFVAPSALMRSFPARLTSVRIRTIPSLAVGQAGVVMCRHIDSGSRYGRKQPDMHDIIEQTQCVAGHRSPGAWALNSAAVPVQRFCAILSTNIIMRTDSSDRDLPNWQLINSSGNVYSTSLYTSIWTLSDSSAASTNLPIF